MKTRLGFIFLVLAVAVIAIIFYTKDYISYDSVRAGGNPSENAQDALGSKNVIDVITNDLYQFYDYSDKAYSKGVLSKLLEDKSEESENIFVHFWASWCSPCVNEVPEIIDFMKKNNPAGSQSKKNAGAKLNKKIKFVIVNLDSESEDIQKFLKSFPDFDKDPFIRIWDKHSYLAKKFGIDKLPATLVIKKNKPLRKINGVVDWNHLEI